MPMPPIEFHVTMFRDERDQARSQYVLLFLMEALCRVNGSLIRHAEKEAKAGRGQKLPLLYRAGVHYEREPPGQEHWPDIVKLLSLFDGPGEYPGPWGDCEDLACWRVSELREAPQHKDKSGKIVKGGVKAKPFAKWRRGDEGQFNYHALVLRPDGKIEDPSLVLGMRREAQFAADGTAEKLKRGEVQPVIQFAEPPDVMVVDPDSPTGYGDRSDPAGLVGARASVTREEAEAKLLEGDIDSFGECLGPVERLLGEVEDDAESPFVEEEAEAPVPAPPAVGPAAPRGQVVIPEIRTEQVRAVAATLRDPVSAAKRSVRDEAQKILRRMLGVASS